MSNSRKLPNFLTEKKRPLSFWIFYIMHDQDGNSRSLTIPQIMKELSSLQVEKDDKVPPLILRLRRLRGLGSNFDHMYSDHSTWLSVYTALSHELEPTTLRWHLGVSKLYGTTRLFISGQSVFRPHTGSNVGLWSVYDQTSDLVEQLRRKLFVVEKKSAPKVSQDTLDAIKRLNLKESLEDEVRNLAQKFVPNLGDTSDHECKLLIPKIDPKTHQVTEYYVVSVTALESLVRAVKDINIWHLK